MLVLQGQKLLLSSLTLAMVGISYLLLRKRVFKRDFSPWSLKGDKLLYKIVTLCVTMTPHSEHVPNPLLLPFESLCFSSEEQGDFLDLLKDETGQEQTCSSKEILPKY